MGECSFTAVRDEKLCDGCVYTYCQHAKKGEVKQMDLLKHMGKRFRKMRNDKGYTDLHVAKSIGVSVATIRSVECGTYLPPYSVYEGMCSVYGVRFGEFMSVYRWEFPQMLKSELSVQISKRFRFLRESEWISVESMAKSIGIAAVELEAIDLGIVVASVDVIKAVSEAYGVTCDWLVGLTEDMHGYWIKDADKGECVA